jgi:hypothetical protein
VNAARRELAKNIDVLCYLKELVVGSSAGGELANNNSNTLAEGCAGCLFQPLPTVHKLLHAQAAAVLLLVLNNSNSGGIVATKDLTAQQNIKDEWFRGLSIIKSIFLFTSVNLRKLELQSSFHLQQTLSEWRKSE